MNVVFLSPHFPPNWYLFVTALRDQGANVLGIADAPHEELRAELRDALDSYYRVDDMNDYGQLVRAVGWLTHQHGKLDRLDSLNEWWLETEAQLRTDFNIPGISVGDIARMKRKSLMKRFFVRAGLTPGRGRVCRSAHATRDFIGEVGYPIVAKPDAGVGAAATFRLDGEADLERYLAEKPAVDYILEEYLSGTLLTYDGLVNRRGEVVFGSSFYYSQGVMEAVNADSDIWYCITREVPPDVDTAGRAIVHTFRLRERPFHFEFFRLPDGTLVPLEINVRPPGGLTVDMFNYANNIDFYRGWASMVVHGRFDESVSRAYACAYVGRKHRFTYRLSHQQVLGRFGDMIVMDTPMSGIFARAIGDFGYIIRHPDEARVQAAALAMQAKVDR
ncbi:MAG TPA: carboxylate--amine ligase [Candidatus Limnocylindria bacterium]|nr:carboxylate--amine ligase [Candidatus Limnocylindria bacterium]